MLNMDLVYSLFLIASYIRLSSATYFSHYHHHRRNCHLRHHNPTSRLSPQHFPPNYITARIPLPHTGQRYYPRNPVPPNVFPVGTVYPATGRQLPNPLDDKNTYDLPPWESTAPIFNNAGPFPNVDNIISKVPTRGDTDINTVNLPPWELSAPVLKNAGPFPNMDNIIPKVPTRGDTDINTVNLPPWEFSAPVFNNGGSFPDVDNIIPQVPTGEVTVMLPQPQPVPTKPDVGNVEILVNPEHFPVNPEFVPINPEPFPINPEPFPINPEPVNPVKGINEGKKPIVVVTDPQPIPTNPGSGVNNGDSNIQGNLPPPIVPMVEDKGCQETGCDVGSECVYENSYICPSDKIDLPCQCQKGCRVQYTFIPFGGTTIVDICGSYCTCNSLFGGENCTWVSCNQDQPANTPSTTAGLVLEPVLPESIDNGPSRGDFPFSVQNGQDPSKTDKKLKFPKQDFVPPIPFLTDNNIGKFPGANKVVSLGKNGPLRPTQTPMSMNTLQKDAMVLPSFK